MVATLKGSYTICVILCCVFKGDNIISGFAFFREFSELSEHNCSSCYLDLFKWYVGQSIRLSNTKLKIINHLIVMGVSSYTWLSWFSNTLPDLNEWLIISPIICFSTMVRIGSGITVSMNNNKLCVNSFCGSDLFNSSWTHIVLQVSFP